MIKTYFRNIYMYTRFVDVDCNIHTPRLTIQAKIVSTDWKKDVTFFISGSRPACKELAIYVYSSRSKRTNQS